MTILDKPDQIQAARLLSLKGMLTLETKGMKRSRSPSAYTIIKKEFGLKGNKQRVLAQFIQLLKERGILK